MLIGRRVLFCFDKRTRPVGGRNVSIGFINELRRMGVAVHPLYPHPKHVYFPFREIDAEPLVFPDLMKRSLPKTKLGRKYWLLKSRVATLFSEFRLLDRRPTDIVVAADTTWPAIRKLFPDNPKVLCVQDARNLMKAWASVGRPEKADFPCAFATSEAAKAALEIMYDGEVAHVPLCLYAGDREFQRLKKKQIALFPRKRPDEVAILTAMIRDFLPDWRVALIEGVADAERDAILRESAIFLSLSRREGFGLPPAEAMLSGCLVVGYTGVGGAEYMTGETCVPVLDDDVTAFISELKKAAGSFREDGTFTSECEKIRRNGFDTVNAKYSYESFRKPFHAFWNRVDMSLRHVEDAQRKS